MDFTPVKSVMDDITAWNIPGCDIAIMKDNAFFIFPSSYISLLYQKVKKAQNLLKIKEM